MEFKKKIILDRHFHFIDGNNFIHTRFFIFPQAKIKINIMNICIGAQLRSWVHSTLGMIKCVK